MATSRLAPVVIVVSVLLISPSAFGGPDGSVSPPAVPSLLSSAADDVFSVADLSTLLDPNGTQHYGPYPSSSPDSSTCGNDWATDTFNRVFTVRTNPDGTFLVVEQFKDGSFVTMFGPSPGACDPSDGFPAGIVNAGVTGSMHGYFTIPLPPGTIQMSTSPNCDAVLNTLPCTTTTFINTHFTACYPATCPVTTFFFHYSAGDQMLVVHEWKNASADRGGNHGDIQNVSVP